jgi:hypothetical protein
MNYAQMSKMHFSENVSTLVNTISDIYCHWVVIHVRSEIQKFIIVFMHYQFNCIIDLFIHTQERSGKVLPRKNIFSWHLWVGLICLLLEMHSSNTSNCEIIIFLNILVLLFCLCCFQLIFGLANTNFGASKLIVNILTVKRFMLDKSYNKISRNESDQIVVLIHNWESSMVTISKGTLDIFH